MAPGGHTVFASSLRRASPQTGAIVHSDDIAWGRALAVSSVALARLLRLPSACMLGSVWGGERRGEVVRASCWVCAARRRRRRLSAPPMFPPFFAPQRSRSKNSLTQRSRASPLFLCKVILLDNTRVAQTAHTCSAYEVSLRASLCARIRAAYLCTRATRPSRGALQSRKRVVAAALFD